MVKSEAYKKFIKPTKKVEHPIQFIKDSGNLLELFAGSRSIGKMGDMLGFKTFSVDWEGYDGIDLQIDISELNMYYVPFVPDVVWASPDCTTYTIAAISKHRNGTNPKSEYARQCDAVNKHFISLIGEWLSINPKMVFFIENPRGMLRHMPFMKDFKRHTVWYCTYGDNRAKPTDIWTNSVDWQPRAQCHNYKYDGDGNIIDKHCHHESARRGSRTGTQGRKGSYDRSKIPEQLCLEILSASRVSSINISNVTDNK